jgi:4-amino-4-deoxy-L-arabinose transferase-like glycosyltransferase
MPTAEEQPAGAAPVAPPSAPTKAAPADAADAWAPRGDARPAAARAAGGRDERRWAWPALALVLAAALGLRLWGIGHGLPYAYNIDEAAQFVPKAIAMSGLHLDPHYFANPPALTYLLHAIYLAWFGSHAAAAHAFHAHPAEVYAIARVTVALLGVVAVWLLYLLGARIFERRIALLAAALETVAFLPVFYSHAALNDVAALVPLTAALIGAAGIAHTARPARTRDYLLAGAGVGLAAATKYTGGIVLVAVLAAVAMRVRAGRSEPAPRLATRSALEGLALAGVVALAAFLLANPYALLDSHAFLSQLGHESAVAAEAGGKLGAAREPTFVYYLWSFTWGLGWIPAIAALGGAVWAWFSDRRAAWLLVPMALVYLAFMSTETRAFGRWILPALPAACLLAALFAMRLSRAVASALARRDGAAGPPRAGPGAPTRARGGTLSGALAAALGALLATALLAQGAVYSVHSDLVLSRPDTRNLTRAWMVANVPAGSRIVLEPGVVEAAWARLSPAPGAVSEVPNRWPDLARTGREEDYAKTLSPALIGAYERSGYCWVVTGSTQWGRAFADPSAAPGAIAYYRALEALGQPVHRVSPFGTAGAAAGAALVGRGGVSAGSRGARMTGGPAFGAEPVPFGYDWSFDYYPLAYHLAGPDMIVWRLHGGRCS